MAKKSNLLMPVGVVIVLLIVGLATYLLTATYKQMPQPTNSQATPSITSVGNDNFLGVNYKLPSGWIASKEEKAINSELVLEDKSTSRKITIIKNYIGGVAGFKDAGKEEKEFELSGTIVKKNYYTEDSNPETISMFTGYGEAPNKYLIIANWKIEDDGAEAIVDEVLRGLSFSN